MENFRELALRRQSCRNFKEEPVAPELLRRCVETAALAPSGCNSQPWRFTIVTDTEKRAALSNIAQEIGLNAWSEKVPAFIVVSEIEEPKLMAKVMDHYHDAKRFAEGDVGMATAYLVLEAAEQGLATCIIGCFTNEELIKLLGLPEGDTVSALIAVGYAADETIRPKQRKPLDEILKTL